MITAYILANVTPSDLAGWKRGSRCPDYRLDDILCKDLAPPSGRTRTDCPISAMPIVVDSTKQHDRALFKPCIIENRAVDS